MSGPLRAGVLVLSALGGCAVHAMETRIVASPKETRASLVGLSEEALRALDARILRGIDEGVSPGAALVVVRRGLPVRIRGYGRLDWAEGADPVTPDSIYDLASLTKVLATTLALAILVDDGQLDLKAPVTRYLPWWRGRDPRRQEVTVEQLLRHRSGLPAFRPFYRDASGRDAFREELAQTGLEHAPGEKTSYSDLGFMTLGLLVEELSDAPLDRFLAERAWRPLGLSDTGFRPDASHRARIAPTEVDQSFRKTHVHGVVHDENAYAMGGVAGHAGLFSSANDLAVYAATLLAGGRVPGAADPPARIVEQETLARFTRHAPTGDERALGWDTPARNASAGRFLTDRAYGHTGFTGTSFWVDPELELAVVLLTNRVNPTRDNQKHAALRSEVCDLAVRAITDCPTPDPRR